MMSRDHLVMDIDQSSLELMLRLLDIDNNVCGALSGTDREDYDKIRQRLFEVCSKTPSHKSRQLTLDDATV